MTQRRTPLARQVRKLRKHYDRLARVAARLEGRPAPSPGLSFKLKVAAMMIQTGKSRRAVVEEMLRKRSDDLGGES